MRRIALPFWSTLPYKGAARTARSPLDRLLEEPWLRIDGISGTSAGAMNAAALAYGYSLRGNDGARVVLERFWRRVAEAGRLSVLRRAPLDIVFGRWTLDNSPIYLAMDVMSRLFSPYELNLAGWNPLRKILTDGVDFEQVSQSPIKLFITATNVATGRPRVFRNRDPTPEVLIASACLPTMFQAIEIGGEAYRRDHGILVHRERSGAVHTFRARKS